MEKLFFTVGRRKLLGQMCMNVCQYLVIAAMASEFLKIPILQRVIILSAAIIFGFVGLKSWPREEEK